MTSSLHTKIRLVHNIIWRLFSIMQHPKRVCLACIVVSVCRLIKSRLGQVIFVLFAVCCPLRNQRKGSSHRDFNSNQTTTKFFGQWQQTHRHNTLSNRGMDRGFTFTWAKRVYTINYNFYGPRTRSFGGILL